MALELKLSSTDFTDREQKIFILTYLSKLVCGYHTCNRKSNVDKINYYSSHNSEDFWTLDDMNDWWAWFKDSNTIQITYRYENTSPKEEVLAQLISMNNSHSYISVVYKK